MKHSRTGRKFSEWAGLAAVATRVLPRLGFRLRELHKLAESRTTKEAIESDREDGGPE